MTDKATEITIPKADLAWALKYGWMWTGEAFVREHRKARDFIRVIPNPREDKPGWVVSLAPCGALQMEAPWSSVRAALRVATQIHLQETFEDGQMSCAEEA